MMMTHIETADCTNNESPYSLQPNNKNGLRAWFFMIHFFLFSSQQSIKNILSSQRTLKLLQQQQRHRLDFVFETIRLRPIIRTNTSAIFLFLQFHDFCLLVYIQLQRMSWTLRSLWWLWSMQIIFYIILQWGLPSLLRMPRRQSLSQWTSSSSSTIDVVRLYARISVFHVTVRGPNTQQGKTEAKQDR